MPRSGSTLQFNIAWKVAEAACLGQRVDWRSSSDWDKAGEELSALSAAPELFVIKLHFLPDSLKALAENNLDIRFLYVDRDLFDVVYSMKTKFNFSLSHAIERVSHSLESERWLLTRPKGQVLFQDYPSLLNQLSGSISQVSTFLAAGLDEDKITEISTELSISSAYNKSRQKKPKFEHIRRKFKRLFGGSINFADAELMLHPNHVSEHRGQLGIGLEKLTDAEINTIKQKFGNRSLGLSYGINNA
jgi:hypothetical protein